MNDDSSPSSDSLPLSREKRVDRFCDEFERQWKAGQGPRIEDYLEGGKHEDRGHLLPELLALEWELLAKAGEQPDPEEYRQRFSQHVGVVDAAWAAYRQGQPDPLATTQDIAPNQEEAGGAPNERPPDNPESVPERIGRFPVERILGKGGFGIVYLAHDPHLDRPVALKVPRPDRARSEADLDLFVVEAKKAVELDHPRIVRVYEVQREPGSVYVVQQYVDGQDLARYAKSNRMTVEQIIELMIGGAEAVGYAHQQGFVHRDLKPANILLNSAGQPHVADFGLALHAEEQRQHRGEVAGTYAYMSPEQVRGEAHRLDGRSDIWSLGVILYELLAGCRPFSGKGFELFDEIKHREPRPLREITPEVPRELSRIVLHCLAKRKIDRYETAADLIDDLRYWQEGEPSQTTPVDERHETPDASAPVKIVPKGLRSFDSGDKDFFLELLPGPRDREGLPGTIRFWKTQIEEPDPESTFAVGVMYGPSGCGKSSLLKAGLLPRLSGDVLPLHVEATAADTEVRLLKRLRKGCPEIPEEVSLPDAFAQLRSRRGSRGCKVLVVLDQFEQWLHACPDYGKSQLIGALRQCDGAGIQCLVLVRADFWMSVTRFMQALEIPLLEGQNSATVDLFDLDHARKVLASFGRAYGRLADSADEFSKPEQRFLDLAIEGLAEEGKVICVRLAVFAEMMKGRPWTAASLRKIGGIEGVGVTFLDESFIAQTAPPAHRREHKAAQAVLEALLPEEGTDIKGQMQSYEQLKKVARAATNFESLLAILDNELRLITATDPDETTGEGADTAVHPEKRYYQLTHDYLTPSLRAWLTREKKKTFRGRAELRLKDRAELWKNKPEKRHLPAWWEYLNIRLLAARKSWTEPQRNMMRKAGRVHAARAAVLLVLIAALSYGGLALRDWFEARALVASLVQAEPDKVLEIANRLSAYGYWAKPSLEQLVVADPQTRDERRTQVKARIALVHFDRSQVPRLQEALLDEEDFAFLDVVGESLEPYQAEIAADLWQVFHDTSEHADKRFRAGLALAKYEPPESDPWPQDDNRFLVEKLVASNPVHQPILWKLLSKVSERLIDPLEQVFLDGKRPETEQIASANALAKFAASKTDQVAELLTKATAGPYKTLYPVLTQAGDKQSRERLRALLKPKPANVVSPKERVAQGKRCAGAAVTLLRLGERESIFDALRVRDDPESLTQFVHGCRARGVTASELLECLDKAADRRRQAIEEGSREREDSVVYGLLLALGEFGLAEVPESEQKALIARLVQWYREDPSSTIHGAAGWLLRELGHQKEVDEVDHTPVAYDDSGKRDWFVTAIPVEGTDPAGEANRENAIYFTFIVYPSGEFLMGSPESEDDHQADERQHRVKLTRRIAVSDRELTWEQFNPFPDSGGRQRAYEEQFGKKSTMQHPAFGVNWFEAIRYCRWLGEQDDDPSTKDQCYADENTLEKDEEGNPKSWPFHPDRSGFRLLTEAEWEYVCRCGTSTAFSFGNDRQWLDRYAYFLDNSQDWSHPVGKLRPNLRGVFDLHGNLFEWCHDWYGEYDSSDGKDPTGPLVGSDRVFRGGGWSGYAGYCRSALRSSRDPTGRNRALGFRVARSLSGK